MENSGHMRIKRNLAKLMPWIVSSCVVLPGHAVAGKIPQFWKDWQFNGFATIGYINSDKYDYRVPRRSIHQNGERVKDNGFLMDSRVGLQVKGDLSDHWSMVGQIVLREQLGHELDDYIDLAFLRYQASNEWQFSFGRQAFDLFFLSDHRNTGYSYEWVRPPTYFYGFMPYESFDGVKVTKDWGDFDNQWHWSFSAGNVSSKFTSEVDADEDDADSIAAKPVYGTELSWQTGKWRVRANYAFFRFEQDLGLKHELEEVVEYVRPHWMDFEHIIDDMSRSNIFRYGSIGLSWEHEDWKVQTEVNVIDSDFIGFNGERGYIMASKRIGEWQPYVTLGFSNDSQEVKYDKPPAHLGPDFGEFYYEVEDFVKGMRHNERSIGVGVRWDLAPQKALKFQCDRYYFDAHSGSVFGRVDENYNNSESNSWCSVALDWVF